ncbi:hypothetical protein J2X31_002087 [Flavobacterium arsenatis]|uniref:Lipoprotein n=1 Tax=Flavobacterium arsenatis TaxID=1484332 RepID=A0ABU1TQ43_9FLAO|nr:hypothetical protein [Flavobacterium arsenatis]MDR6968072.1 hypothetical protein [Flavobacterium arsenatis]
MKNLYKLIFLFLLFHSLSSCKKETPLEFEKDVMCEILPALLDSLAVDRRLMYPPPVAKIIFDKNDNRIRLDSSDLDIRRKEFEENLMKIEQDTNVVFVIKDFVNELEDEDWNTRNDYFKNVVFEKDSINSKQKYKIDLSCVSKYKLKYRSKFKETNDFFIDKYKFFVGGLLSFSRIHFDKNHEHGVLSTSYLCGGNCGQGFKVYLKKIKNEWVIEKIIPTWIA